MRRVAILLGAAVLAGCVSIAKVDTGDRVIGDRLSITIEGEWNHVQAPGLGPAQNWTMEGFPVDQLLIYSGLKDGELLHAKSAGSRQKDFAFRASMQPHEIAAAFEGMLTRDGSSFTLVQLAPVPFGGLRGFRFDFTLTRKIDNVVLTGVGWGAVSRAELFAILYMAPRLGFFPRHAQRVERIAAGARIRE